MTRSPGPATRFQYRTFGVPHAHRAVLVLREGAAAITDPRPEATSAHDVRIIAVRLWPREIDDPGAYGGETPATTTVEALLALANDQTTVGDRIGLVGVGDVGAVAILLAGRSPALFDRLALVGVPRPDAPLERDIAVRSLAEVSTRTLVINGTDDPIAPASDAQWHADLLANSTVSFAARRPGSLDPRLSLTDVWAEVLRYVAPDD